MWPCYSGYRGQNIVVFNNGIKKGLQGWIPKESKVIPLSTKGERHLKTVNEN